MRTVAASQPNAAQKPGPRQLKISAADPHNSAWGVCIAPEGGTCIVKTRALRKKYKLKRSKVGAVDLRISAPTSVSLETLSLPIMLVSINVLRYLPTGSRNALTSPTQIGDAAGGQRANWAVPMRGKEADHNMSTSG
ncbi:hypothetical protein AB3X96_33200 [Paraburkholderia sp. BR13439]|uniref:hypothetical protein n=1 Tax=Paraburkholderia TaxID=1822464 RepID=UPI0034CF8994